jgi:hypothetical protein
MIGDSPCRRFRSSQFGMIAGIKVVPAIRNFALVVDNGYFGRFRLRQLGAVARCPAVLAGRQVPREVRCAVRRLGNQENRPQGDAGYLRSNKSPRADSHFPAAVRELDKLTETDTRSRSAQIISSSEILFDLVFVFIEFRDVGLVARVGYRLHKRVSALGS